MSGHGCCLYIIAVLKEDEAVAPIKIGISDNPWSRLSTIQTSCPFKLVLYHLFNLPNREMARLIELDMHDAFDNDRSWGEWFNAKPEDAYYTASKNIEALVVPPNSTEEQRIRELKKCRIDPNYGRHHDR